MKAFFEQIYYRPRVYQYFIILLLFPLSILYGVIMLIRRLAAKPKEYGLPIVSVGNLIVGGSGKTPFVIALAKRYENVCVISRGYGRQGRGLVEVSQKGHLLCDVKESGDEAMLMAQSLPHASVIVSESRTEAIELAKRQGVEVIVLDDGFNRVNIKKFEIILEPEHIPNRLPFPAGPYREFSFASRYADMVLKEGRDFTRQVERGEHHCHRVLLATAIANPSRLEPYLPSGLVGKYILEDHAYFDEAVLAAKLKEYDADCLLVTQKDAVKMRGFKLPIVEMKLKLDIDEKMLEKVDLYIKEYKESNGL